MPCVARCLLSFAKQRMTSGLSVVCTERVPSAGDGVDRLWHVSTSKWHNDALQLLASASTGLAGQGRGRARCNIQSHTGRALPPPAV